MVLKKINTFKTKRVLYIYITCVILIAFTHHSNTICTLYISLPQTPKQIKNEQCMNSRFATIELKIVVHTVRDASQLAAR